MGAPRLHHRLRPRGDHGEAAKALASALLKAAPDAEGYGADHALAARIVAAAEAYDVLVSGRPYQNPLPPTEAIGRLFAEAGGQFDARVVAPWRGW